MKTERIPIALFLKSVVVLALFTANVRSLIAQHANRPIPNGLFSYEFRSVKEQGNGFYLATLNKEGDKREHPNFIDPYPVIFDEQGYIYWFGAINSDRCVDFKYHPNLGIYSFTNIYSGEVSFILLDKAFNLLDTLHPLNDGVEDIHEFLILEDGNRILATSTFDTFDLSGFNFADLVGGPETVIKGFGFQEITDSGDLVFEWNSNDWIDPKDCDPNYPASKHVFDYCHGNAIEVDDDGHFLVSLRNLNAIYKINRSSGEVIWKLGGVSSDFTFVNDHGFSGQHDIRKLSNGNYSLFDNAIISNDSRGSRAVEYVLDITNWTATKVWEYYHEPPVSSSARGNHQTMTDGGKTLGYGLCYRPAPSIVHLDKKEEVIAEFYFQDSVVSYRTFCFNLPVIKRPEILVEKSTDGLKLTARKETVEYMWSTGENSRSIIVTEKDTVQLWIPQSIGYLGSKPVIVTEAMILLFNR